MTRPASVSAAIMIQLNNSAFFAGLCRSWTSFLPGMKREGATNSAGLSGAVLAPGAGAGPGGVTSPGSWEQGQGKPRRPSYYIQCRAERSVRALAALIPLPGRQPRRSSELRILLWGSEEAGTGAASLLPRTTKKNAEVGAALLCRALYGPQCPESSSYPLAPQSLKDRTVSWVGPNSEEVTNCLPTLEKLLSTRQKTSHVENGSV